MNRRAVPFRTMRYGPHPDQVFDLRDGSQPVGVVLVHGGFWLDAWGRDTTEAWAVDLSAAGIPTANLEYRRLGSGGGRVTTVSDVSRALGEAIDHLGTERVIVVGHSAGAHLAIAAMTAHAAPGAASLAAIISVGGVLDLETALRADLGEGAVARFDPHAATSPLTSPPPPCQVVLVHGDHDGAVPAAQSRAYADYLDRLGADVSLHIVKGEGHFRALDPDSRTWQSVMAAIGGGDDR